MYKLFTEQGKDLHFEAPYDMSCRVAHSVRKLGVKCGVVGETGRFMSEVVPNEPTLDASAMQTAKNLLGKLD